MNLVRLFASGLLAGTLVFATSPLGAATGGSISGVITDPSGAVIPGATLVLVNTARGTAYTVVSGSDGMYTFPNLPVGPYKLTITAPGFGPQERSGLAIDTDVAVEVDATLSLGKQSELLTVASSGAPQVETMATHLGQVVASPEILALPLNGRSYTDLLAIQPGVVPASTLLPSSIIMAGVTGSLDPSGDLNPGNLSINGQRESSNGYLLNGVDVQEPMNGGTSVIPNLDSIEEFRVLTANFDPEYGNYNGGIVTVISKAGTGTLHGSAFEFLRNTALDARGYFDPTRPAFRQNQFGGTLGGPLRRDRLFFFGDYQGTRTTEGISTGDISVPTLAERSGTFLPSALTGSVSGPYLASLLSQRLGTPVSAGEPYAAVFPNGAIPQSAWSAPGRNLLGYIPTPNVGADQFSSSAFAQTVRDDKGSGRVDANSRFGQLAAYYFVDDYRLDNPYPGAVGGASIPGFDALTSGRTQLLTAGATTVLNASTVNELHLGFLRDANIIGKPQGGLGVSLAAQGFATGAGTPGIVVQAPQFEGVQNITFPTFTMGVPITNETQVNNTFFVSDGLSGVRGAHTLKLGGQFHLNQVNEHPNATFNGTFNINGTETGSPFADLLLGTPSNFTQSSGQPFYLRNRYGGLYAQDSWRARTDLTVNFGLRWDLILPWWEKNNEVQTFVAGAQSVLFPGAPRGLLVPGDPGIPRTLAPASYRNFAPRAGFAFAPHFGQGLGKAIFGDSGKSSIRASYGLFYTAFPGLTAGIMYAVPPFGYTYLSPGPPLLATPFITAASGVDNGQRFPFPFPPHTVSRRSPDNAINWANFLPLAGDPFFDTRNQAPYIHSYMLSVERQVTPHAVFTASFVGNQGHRILALVSVNPGNAALCLSLPGCGPFGEDSPYTSSSGQLVEGTRMGQGPGYGENTADRSIASSSYNALESTLRYNRNGSQFLLSYTYAKSLDQGSNLGEQLDPLDLGHTRALSAYDLKHDFVASYSWLLPLPALLEARNRWTEQWSLSGTSRFATGFPVTLLDNSDRSLLGTLGNGANNYLLDTPAYTPGPLHIQTNGRSGQPAFNTALFHEETLGQLGNAKRRAFYGPGIENFDMALAKGVRLRDTQQLELRLEGFNVFNHAQFYGPASVNGQIEDSNFGQIVSAAPPRLVQLAGKFTF